MNPLEERAALVSRLAGVSRSGSGVALVLFCRMERMNGRLYAILRNFHQSDLKRLSRKCFFFFSILLLL